MLELTFRDFYKGDWTKLGMTGPGFDLYMVIDELDILYVGISKHIYSRWFSDIDRRHISIQGGKIFGFSPIGEYIARSVPWSWDFTLRLYSAIELREICGEILLMRKNYLTKKKFYELDPFRFVDSFEDILINYLSPDCNYIGNTKAQDLARNTEFIKTGRLSAEFYYSERPRPYVK